MKSFLLAFFLVLLFTSSASAQANKWVKGFQNGIAAVNTVCEKVEIGGSCYFAFGTGTQSPASATTFPIRLNAARGEICINPNIAGIGQSPGGVLVGIRKNVNDVTANGSTLLLPRSAMPFTDGAVVVSCLPITRGTYIVQFTVSGTGEQSTLRIRGY